MESARVDLVDEDFREISMTEKRSKYGAIKTEVDGYIFHSRKEAARYQELKLLEMAGEIQNLTLQPPYPCFVGGKLICTYVADFSYRDRASFRVEDVKGYKTDVYKLKKKLVEAIYNIKIEEV
jgi:hypothetical protein